MALPARVQGLVTPTRPHLGTSESSKPRKPGIAAWLPFEKSPKASVLVSLRQDENSTPLPLEQG